MSVPTIPSAPDPADRADADATTSADRAADRADATTSAGGDRADGDRANAPAHLSADARTTDVDRLLSGLAAAL